MNKDEHKMTNKKKNSNIYSKPSKLKINKDDSINDSLVSNGININKKSISGGLNPINKGSNNKNIKNLYKDLLSSSKNNKIEKKILKKVIKN